MYLTHPSFSQTNKQVLKVTPIAYEEDFPFPYNNFVFAVHINRESTPPKEENLRAKQPGCQTIPVDEETFICRVPNPLSGYNDKVRVQNEVAALSLAREALQPSLLSHLVPRVYGWASAENGGNGWILQQYMSGSGPLAEFSSWSEEDKANILEQMADVLACLQRFQLPSTIDQYGGVGFDAEGNYVNTALSMYDAGPFETYPELLRATITSKLIKADGDSRVRGWRDNGIRARLDEFLNRGLPTLLQGVASLDKVLVHADFCKISPPILSKKKKKTPEEEEEEEEEESTLSLTNQTPLDSSRQHPLRPINQKTNRHLRLRFRPHQLRRRRIFPISRPRHWSFSLHPR